MSTQLHSTISTLSLDRVVLQVDTAALCWLCTRFRWGRPLCAQPSGSVKQHLAALLDQEFLVCTLWYSPISAGSSSLRMAEDLLQHPAGWSENVGGAPSHYPGSGKI